MPIGKGCVLIGMSERTSRQAISQAAAALFAKGAVERVIIAALPKLLPSFIDFLKSWLERKKLRKVTFNGTLNGHPIDFSGSPQDLEKLVKALTPPAPKPAASKS